MTLDLRETTSGVVGAVFNVYAGLPFDVVKVRLQTQGTTTTQYTGLVDCFAKTIRQESVRSLWKGAIPALSSAVIENAVLFSANGALKRVFFSSNESLSTMDEALIGSASGVFSAAAITPAEVIKCRLQTYTHAESMGIFRCMQNIVKESGVMGLTSGLGAVMLRDIPFNFCFFGLYDFYATRFMDMLGAESRRELHPLAVLTSGGFAGASSWTIVFPADVIKSRMQVDSTLTFKSAVRKIWRVQGAIGFYRGWSSAVMGSFPADGCLFLGVEMTHRLFAHLEVLVMVFILGIFVALFTCHAQNLLNGVSRALWQVELWIYSIYVTDSKLKVPHIELITLSKTWWTFVYFALTKSLYDSYYLVIFSTISDAHQQFINDSIPTSGPTWTSFLPSNMPTSDPTSDRKKIDSDLIGLCVLILVWFLVNIVFVSFTTYITKSYYTWLMKNAMTHETQQLKSQMDVRGLPYQFEPNSKSYPGPPRQLHPPLPVSLYGPVRGGYPPDPPPPPLRLEPNSPSQSSISSMSSSSSHKSSGSTNSVHAPNQGQIRQDVSRQVFPPVPPMPPAPPMQSFPMQPLPPVGPTFATRARSEWRFPADDMNQLPQTGPNMHPMLHFPSTLAERNGVIGFPVPPPPPVEGGPFWKEWFGGSQRRSSQTSEQEMNDQQMAHTVDRVVADHTQTHIKKKHHMKHAKHAPSNGDGIVAHAHHQVHALKRMLHHRDSSYDHAKQSYEALVQITCQVQSKQEREKLDQFCNEFNESLALWKTELQEKAESEEKAKQTTKNEDTIMEIAWFRLRALLDEWRTSTHTNEMAEHILNQLDRLRQVVSAIPSTNIQLEIFHHDCNELDDSIKEWKRQSKSKSTQDERKNIERQLDSIRQTLAHGAGLSEANMKGLEQICIDLETKLNEITDDEKPLEGTSDVIETIPTEEVEESKPEEKPEEKPEAIVSPVEPPTSVANIVENIDELDDDTVVGALDRPLVQTQPYTTGWLSPTSYLPPLAYGTLSPMESSFTLATYDQLSPIHNQDSIDRSYRNADENTSNPSYGVLSPLAGEPRRIFEANPTYRAIESPKEDKVHFVAYAPPKVHYAMRFKYIIWAFLVNQREEMTERARANDERSKQLSREMLMQIRRGAIAHVQLEVPNGFVLDSDPIQSLAWHGDVTDVEYKVQCTSDSALGQVFFKATIVVGSNVMVLRSYMTVAGQKSLDDDNSSRELNSFLENLPKTYTEIPFESIEMHELVGRGYFGDAYRAKYNGKEVVVKTIRSNEWTDQIIQEFRHEAAVLNMFGHHPHIVPFLGASTDPSSTLSLVTEYLPCGSIEDQYKRGLTKHQKTVIVGDAAAGILNMHEGSFVHRDIAARNCLVDQNLRGKICDFGLCRRVDAKYGGSHLGEHGIGPLKYMAPESLAFPHGFSYKSDVYSFGVLLWETFTEFKPYANMTTQEAASYVLEGGRLDGVKETIPIGIQSLLIQCFQEDPSKRPDMIDIYQECQRLVNVVD